MKFYSNRRFYPYQEEAGESSGGGSEPPAATPPKPNTEELARYQAKFDAEKAARIKTEKEFAEFRRKFEAIDPEKYQELMQANEQREIDEKKRRGEFDKLETDLRNQLGEKDTQIKTLQQQLEDQALSYQLGDSFTSSEARGKADFKADYVDKARKYLAKNDDGEWIVQNPKGGRLFMDEAGREPVENFDQLAIYMRENTPYGIYYNPIQGKGSGSTGSSSVIDGGSPDHLMGMERL